jgi:N4-gp56 family major capsid protein
MATTTTSNLEAAQKALGIYYDKVVIESLQPNLYFEQFGTIVGVPQGNYTSRFFTFNKIATSSVTTLTEGTPPTGIAVSVNAIDTTPTQYGVNVELTDLVALTAVFDLVNTTLSEVGKAMARKIDSVIQTVVNAGTNVIYAGGKTSRSALTASDLFDAGLVRQAAAKLRKNAAPEFSDRGGGYVAITTPEVVFDLKSNTSVGQWLDMHKYAAPENLFNGEVGSMDGVRIVQSPNVDTFSSTVTVHPTTFIAKDAYRISYWLANKVNTYVLPPESNLSVSNPLGQKGSVGAKTNMGVARTQEERLVRVESAASAL